MFSKRLDWLNQYEPDYGFALKEIGKLILAHRIAAAQAEKAVDSDSLLPEHHRAQAGRLQSIREQLEYAAELEGAFSDPNASSNKGQW